MEKRYKIGLFFDVETAYDGWFPKGGAFGDG